MSWKAAESNASPPHNDVAIRRLLETEAALDTEGEGCWGRFRRRVENHKVELITLLKELKSQGKMVLGYGASTKGNVILQYCGLTPDDIPAIAEVNESKFGARTPGSAIPIISEAEAKAMKPDYFLVLPWHFRDNIIIREREFLASGGKLIFPLSTIEIVAR